MRKSCGCTRAKLTIRDDRAFCLRCERFHTKVSANPGAPLYIAPVPLGANGKPMRCVERATPDNAVDAVDTCIDGGGSKEDALWNLRRTMCGAYTPKADYIEGMQRGFNRIEQKLDSRDNPGGVTIRKVKAEKKPGG